MCAHKHMCVYEYINKSVFCVLFLFNTQKNYANKKKRKKDKGKNSYVPRLWFLVVIPLADSSFLKILVIKKTKYCNITAAS